MFKPIMRFILSAIAVISVTSILTSPSITPPQHNGTPTLNFVDEQLLRSSRYTQMDETNSAVLNRFADEFTLSYTPSQLDLMGFEPVMENESMKLYFEKD
jgi:hypothetical protein